MKKIMYLAISADGYIARDNDETPWSECEWKEYAKKVKKAGALIIGRRTYEIMHKQKELEKLDNKLTVVVSKSEFAPDGCVVVKSPEQAVELLDEKGFREVIIGGGKLLNNHFIKYGLVDEIITDIEPVIFGEGIPLFAEAINQKLKIDKVKKKKGYVQVTYKVIDILN